jgi:hypothetical protein
MKRTLIIIGCMAIVLCIALSCSQSDGSAPPVLANAPAEGIIDLKNLDQLKEAFQRDHGTVRLVSLLSPV